MKVHSCVALAMTGTTAIGCQALSILWQSKFRITWHVFSFEHSYCLNFAYRRLSWTFISILRHVVRPLLLFRFFRRRRYAAAAATATAAAVSSV